MTEEDDGDTSDLRRRTFLERHTRIPQVAAAVLVGSVRGFVSGSL